MDLLNESIDTVYAQYLYRKNINVAIYQFLIMKPYKIALLSLSMNTINLQNQYSSQIDIEYCKKLQTGEHEIRKKIIVYLCNNLQNNISYCKKYNFLMRKNKRYSHNRHSGKQAVKRCMLIPVFP